MIKKSKSIKIIFGLAISYLCLFLLTGCQSKNALEDGTYMMKVTSIGDDTISGLVSQQMEQRTDEKMGEMPQGEAPPQGEGMPTGDSSMTPPQNGDLPSDGGKGPMMEEEGTETTLTLNNQTKISQGMMNQETQEVTLDNLSVDTMVSVTVKDGSVTEINIQTMDQAPGDFNGTDSTAEISTDSTL